MVNVRSHVDLCLKVNLAFHLVGRYLLHEHVLAASSRNELGIVILEVLGGVMRTGAHMCRYGVPQMIGQGPMLLKMPPGFLMNALVVASHLSKWCQGERAHVKLECKKRTRQAQLYAEHLRHASCRSPMGAGAVGCICAMPGRGD